MYYETQLVATMLDAECRLTKRCFIEFLTYWYLLIRSISKYVVRPCVCVLIFICVMVSSFYKLPLQL